MCITENTHMSTQPSPQEIRVRGWVRSFRGRRAGEGEREDPASYSLGFPPKKLQDIAKAVRGARGDVAKRNRQMSGGWSPACLCLTCYQ